MNIPLYISKALKGDKTQHGRRSLLASRIAKISVAVSLMVMIIAMAVVRGFRTEIEQKAMGFSGQILLEAPGAGFLTETFPTTTSLSYLSAMENLGCVSHLQAFATRSGLIRTDSAIHGAVYKGVGPSYDWTFFSRCLTAGRIPRIDSSKLSDELLISQRLSRATGLSVGDRVTMYFIDEHVRFRRFNICGIYNAQLEDIDNHLIMGDIRHAQRLNSWAPDQVSGIEIFLNPGESLQACQEQIESFIVEASVDTDPGVVLRNVRDIYSHLFDWLELLDLNVWILLTLMVLVAGFNMISSLLILLFEKTSMVGLLKALGMSNRDIAKSFLYQASAIFLGGMLAGNIPALLFCFVQHNWHWIKLDPVNYFVRYVPIDLNLWTLLGINLLAFAGIMLLLLLPLIVITKISPQRTIRMQ